MENEDYYPPEEDAMKYALNERDINYNFSPEEVYENCLDMEDKKKKRYEYLYGLVYKNSIMYWLLICLG